VGFVLLVIGGIVVLAADEPLRIVGRALQWLWNVSFGRHNKTTALDQRLLSQRDQIRSVLGRDWRRAVLLIGGRLGLDYLCLLCALRATGSDPNASLVLLTYAAAQIIALVPITPGGLGIVEASLSGLLMLAGVNTEKAIVATLAYRLTGCRSSGVPWPTRCTGGGMGRFPSTTLAMAVPSRAPLSSLPGSTPRRGITGLVRILSLVVPFRETPGWRRVPRHWTGTTRRLRRPPDYAIGPEFFVILAWRLRLRGI